MFELNGEQYSLQQVEEAAKQSSMSLDDYVSEYGLIKIGRYFFGITTKT
jgi:hypothetical protein